MKKFSLLLAVAMAVVFGTKAADLSSLQQFRSNFESSTDSHLPEGWTSFGAGYEATGTMYQGGQPYADASYFFPSDEPNYLIYGLDGYVPAWSNSTTVKSTYEDEDGNIVPGEAVDEWLVSPEIEVTEALMLQFKVLAFGGKYCSDSYCNYAVYVSTTGAAKEDFTGEPLIDNKLSINDDASNYVVRNAKVSLKDYVGEKIHIAFVNRSDGAFMTGFANIELFQLLMDVNDKTSPYVTEPGKQPIKMAVKIQTPYECKGFTAKMVASDGTTDEWSNTKELSKTLGTYNFQFDGVEVKNQGESVSYTVTVTPNVEGAPSIDIKGKVAYSFTYPSIAVMEEATGSWCGWCPRGNAAMKKFKDDYGDKFIPIAVHSGDMMYLSDYSDNLSVYVSGYPNAVINRAASCDPISAQSQIDKVLANGAIGDLEIVKGIYDEDKEQIEIEFNSTIGYTSDNMTMSVAAVITEDGVKGNNSAWSQSNYYIQFTEASFPHTSEWLPYLKDYLSGGSLGYDYVPSSLAVYDHVAWGIFDDYYGMPLNAVYKANETQNGKISFDIPYTYYSAYYGQELGGVQNIENTTVVLLLLDDATGEIVNADFIPYAELEKGVVSVESTVLSGYSVAQDGDMLVVNAEEGATVNVYGIDGTLLASQVMTGNVATINGAAYQGVVLVRIQKGNEASIRKLIWK